MAKRDYTSKAAQNVNNFVNKEKEPSPLPQVEPAEQTVERAEKKGRPYSERETKVRKSFAIFPSLYEDVQKVAFVKRISISELIADLLRDYVERNKEALSEYDNLK